MITILLLFNHTPFVGFKGLLKESLVDSLLRYEGTNRSSGIYRKQKTKRALTILSVELTRASMMIN